MNKRLEKKVALVTGSTSGIGLGIAKLFAQNGAQVVVTGRREARGNQVVADIVAAGGEACYFFSDVTKPETVEALIDKTVEKYGKLDILVNNAANVGLQDGSVEELSVEMWDSIMESDLRSVFISIKHALAYLRKNGGGSIINIGSCASANGDLGATAYASAKAGVNLLTQYTALQYGKENIRCNCIRPGLIITPENDSQVSDFVKNVFLDNLAVNRYGNPQDIAYMCVYFASDESEYVTGQIIDVDGGLNSHTPTVAQFRQANSRTW